MRTGNRIERRVTNLLDQRSGKSLDVRSLSPSIPPPSSIRTSSPSSLNSGRQRVIYCAERERERGGGGSCNGRPRPSVRPPGGLRYLSSSSYFAAPQLPPPPPSNSACVYCSRSYKWHPLSPQSPRRSTATRGERAAAGRQNWPNISAAEWEKEGKGSPSVRPSVSLSVCLSLFPMIVLEWLLAAGSH